MKNLDDLIKRIGMAGVVFEQNLYAMAEHHSDNYIGGNWISKTLTDDEGNELDGFYLELDNDTMYEIKNSYNMMNAKPVDSKIFSLIMFCHCANVIGFHFYEKDEEDIADVLFKLSEFARYNASEILGEEKAAAFYRFID